MFNAPLETAIDKRKDIYAITNATRLVNGSGDGVDGVTVDQYNRHFVIQLFNQSALKSLEETKAYIIKKFDPEYLIVKYRTSLDPESVYDPRHEIIIDKSGSKTIVSENNMKFTVDLNDAVNTGFFLDMRKNRDIVSSFAKGKAVLNCFSYTCSFGVYCKIRGAQKVINLDINNKSLERGKENYRLNNISFEDDEFVKKDCIDYLTVAVKKKNLFDLIIIDPPSFSRYNGKVFSVKKDLQRLIELGMAALAQKGYLFVSTNFSVMANDTLIRLIRKEALAKKYIVRQIMPLGQDKDFPASAAMKESHLAAVFVKIEKSGG